MTNDPQTTATIDWTATMTAHQKEEEKIVIYDLAEKFALVGNTPEVSFQKAQSFRAYAATFFQGLEG